MKYSENWQTMKIITKRSFVRLVKLLMILFISIFIVAVGHVYITVNELKLKLAETKISFSDNKIIESTLEKNSKIKRDDLENYKLFLKGNSLTNEENQLSDENTNNLSDSIFIEEDIILNPLETNSCKRIRCIQVRKPFSETPSNIWKALLGTEDFRFLDHKGVDPIAIARAIIVDIIAMKFIQGGSTLTQQLVKNQFLTNDKTLSRKLKEVIYALYIEHVLSKEEILSLYLNEVFWGTYEGIYLKGYHAASLAYFGKKPEKLSEFEATILVSFLKGPNFYKLTKGYERIKNRSNAVFKRLTELNLFSRETNRKWNEKDWQQFQEDYMRKAEFGNFKAYSFVSTNSEQGLESFEKMVFYRSVFAKEAELKSRFKGVDLATKALILNIECESFDCPKGFSYYSKIEREKRIAITEEFHQVGSLLKPIVYDSLIKLGRSYDEIVSTKPITLNLKSGNWTPKDYSKAKKSEITLKEALQKSKNIPLVRAVSEVGFELMEKQIKDYIPRLKLPLGEYPAQLLGAVELSLDEVVRSYKKFIKNKCREIELGEEEFENSVLKYMSTAKETTISRLARGSLKNSLVFGKTGTSNNGLDNWFFAFDGSQVYIYWFGVETRRDQANLRVSGATTSFLMFQDFTNFRGKETSEVVCK